MNPTDRLIYLYEIDKRSKSELRATHFDRLMNWFDVVYFVSPSGKILIEYFMWSVCGFLHALDGYFDVSTMLFVTSLVFCLHWIYHDIMNNATFHQGVSISIQFVLTCYVFRSSLSLFRSLQRSFTWYTLLWLTQLNILTGNANREHKHSSVVWTTNFDP